jgi:hypothetical protein
MLLPVASREASGLVGQAHPLRLHMSATVHVNRTLYASVK